MSDPPPPTPAGALIRRARETSVPRRSIPEVAHSAGIDPGTLGNIERGYRHAGGGRVRPVSADAATLAKLARELGVTPGQLEDEGERPDAARILREMQHREPSAPPVPAGTPPPSAMARALFPGDPAKQRLYDLPDMDDTEKAALFEALDEARARRDGKPGIRDSA